MNPFLRVIDALNRHEVRYVIVGGLARWLCGRSDGIGLFQLVIEQQSTGLEQVDESLKSVGLRRVEVASRNHAERERSVFIDTSQPCFLLVLTRAGPGAFQRILADSMVSRLRRRSIRIARSVETETIPEAIHDLLLLLFCRTTPTQKVRWLGDLMEISTWAQEYLKRRDTVPQRWQAARQ